MSSELKPMGGVDPLFPASGEVYLSPGGFYVNDVHGGKENLEWLEKNFEAKDDDVYVVSYPKTGTTWVQEIVYCIVNDLDFEKAKSKVLTERFPYLELSITIQNGWINDLTQPRLIKSHYPYSMLPQSIKDKKCKLIYPVRNPKDTLKSLYHFMKINPVIMYTGDFPTVFDLFIKEERTIYSPFSKHILEFWERRNQDNILIVYYEDLKKDANAGIKQIAQFLGKELSDEQIQKIADHCSFKSMKENPSTNYSQFMKGDFMRKGEVGDWKKLFTDEMNAKMDKYVETKFGGTGFQFRY